MEDTDRSGSCIAVWLARWAAAALTLMSLSTFAGLSGGQPAGPFEPVGPSKLTVQLIEEAQFRGSQPSPPRAGQVFTIEIDVRSMREASVQELQRDLVVYINGVEAPRAKRVAVSSLFVRPGRASDDSSTLALARIALTQVAPDTLTEPIELVIQSRSGNREVGRHLFESDPSAVQQKVAQFLGVEQNQAFIILAVVSTLIAAVTSGTVGFLLARRRRESLSETVQPVRETFSIHKTLTYSAEDQASAVPAAIPDYITESLKRGTLALVVGSGVAGQAGLKVGPSLWLALIDRVLVDPATEPEKATLLMSLREEVVSRGAGEIIDAIVGVIGRAVVVDAISKEFSSVTPVVSPLHIALARMKCRVVIDMTWDSVTPSLLGAYKVFTPNNSDGIVSAMRADLPCLLKPLGYLSDEEGLSLTTQDLKRSLSRAPEFARALASIATSSNLMFVGMGLPAIEVLLGSLPGFIETANKNNIALIPRGEESAIWQAGTGMSYGVQLVPYAPGNDHAQLKELIGRLAASLKQAGIGPESRKALANQERLTGVRLENIGVFKKLELDIDEKWTVLLGDNGSGKSTVLKAMACALAGADERATPYAARLLRSGEKSGSIVLKFGASTEFKTQLSRYGASVKAQSAYSPLQTGSLVALGFPVLRGVTMSSPTGAKQILSADPSVDDVMMLLSGAVDTRLDDLKQWLVNCFVNSEHAAGGRDALMLETIRSVFQSMMPVDGAYIKDIDRDTWSIIVATRDGDVDLDALSQGMGSIFNWVGVLLTRLYELYPNSPNPENEFALVLIDEIDAHLHPQWQRKLLELAQEKFPNIQVIATTHSPLLAGAVARGQLRVVHRDVNGQAAVEEPEFDLSGQRVDDILTSSLFALRTTRSLMAENEIKEYFALYERPKGELTAAEEIKLQHLARRMARLNFGTLAPAWAIAAEEPNLAKALDSMTAEELYTLRSRVDRMNNTSPGNTA